MEYPKLSYQTKALRLAFPLNLVISRIRIGAVLFLAAIYPRTLLPMLIYALVLAAYSVILAPAIGG